MVTKPPVRRAAKSSAATPATKKASAKKAAPKDAAPKKSAVAKAAKAVKPAEKPAAVKKSPQASRVAASPKPAPADDAKRVKTKLVRDSFTIPKAEYAVLAALKERALRLGRHSKKSELLRSGIKALAALDDAAFLSALEAVPAIKTGRPKVKDAATPAD